MNSDTNNGRRPLILCLDDAEIAVRVRQWFAVSGYELLTAKSGEDGLELFRQNAVALVISDHFLCGKTGAETAREMKKLKPEVPILIVSGAAGKPEALEFADGFVPKCEPPDILLELVIALLINRRKTVLPRLKSAA